MNEAEKGELLLGPLNIAQGDTGQSRVVAGFLLGLYNGCRLPFDITEFRRLDRRLFEDCLAILNMGQWLCDNHDSTIYDFIHLNTHEKVNHDLRNLQR